MHLEKYSRIRGDFSNIRIRHPSQPEEGRSGSALPPFFCKMETVKTDPFPYSLSTEISPSIIWQSALEMASPNPVPSMPWL